MKAVFAIGDVHGCADELRQLLEQLPLSSESTVVFLGDYIDRGSQSKDVVETVLELAERCTVIPLMGNHEWMFRYFLDDPESERAGLFIYNGGSATLASYADPRGHYELPPTHEAFYRNLHLWYETDRHFFVHGGVPEIPLADLDPEQHGDMVLWMRGKFLRSEYPWEKTIVHGHTPVNSVTIAPNRINLDTGCVFDMRLSSIQLPGQKVVSVPKMVDQRPIYLRDLSSRRAAIRFRGRLPVRLHRGEEIIDFETVDYSEVGMYMRDLEFRDRMVLSAHERIDGIIGSGEESGVIHFSGVVVRSKRQDDGDHYAIKILSTAPGPK